ncbi:unnamed protein product [Brassica napus]|uniref:(rape) hypothetical protein n=1 Tax=Brassica napus TaxID=3708 RepID=A0A817ARJ4_BRANA|nr:unnamed protein product [Brassica napus]
MEMVLADSKGDMIHATVKKELVSQFVTLISQGESKLMVNFIVTMAAGSYRPTKHPYRIVFLPTTRLRMCDALPSNLTGLDPVKFESIKDGSQNTDYLVDVIGQIVEVSHVEVVSVNGKDTQKLSLELRNQDDDRLPMVLWGKFATDVNDAIQLRGEHKIIVVLRFGKIKVWKDERSISNAYNVSDVALNPNLEEVQTFIELLPKDDMALAIVDPKPLALTNGVSDKDDFFIHTPRKSIADVKASRQGSETFKAIDNSIVSDAPEGSMMLRGCSSQQSDSTSLTPAKRIGAPVINLDETFDQTSVTRTNCPVKIKKEKKDKSG